MPTARALVTNSPRPCNLCVLRPILLTSDHLKSGQTRCSSLGCPVWDSGKMEEDRQANELEDIVEQLKRAVQEARAVSAHRVEANRPSSSSKPVEPALSPTPDNKALRYDTRAALEMKERREAAHTKAIEKRMEKEMQGCTFKPSLNRKSLEIAADKGHKFSPVQDRKAREGPAEIPPPCTSSPTINANSRLLAEKKDRNGPIHERLMQFEAQRQRKLEDRAVEMTRRELETMTGTPQIDKHSEEISRRKVLDGSLPEDPFKRLANFEVLPHSLQAELLPAVLSPSPKNHFRRPERLEVSLIQPLSHPRSTNRRGGCGGGDASGHHYGMPLVGHLSKGSSEVPLHSRTHVPTRPSPSTPTSKRTHTCR